MNNKLSVLKNLHDVYSMANAEYSTQVKINTNYTDYIRKEYKEKRAGIVKEFNKLINDLDDEFESAIKKVEQDEEFCQLKQDTERKQADFSRELESFRREHRVNEGNLIKYLEKETGLEWKYVKSCKQYSAKLLSGMYDVSATQKIYLVNELCPLYDEDNPNLEEFIDCHPDNKTAFRILSRRTTVVVDEREVRNTARQNIQEMDNVNYLTIYYKKYMPLALHKQEREMFVANEYITDLVCKAIDNQYFNQEESENE